MPAMSARSRVVEVPAIQGAIDALYAECNAALEVPLRGITANEDPFYSSIHSPVVLIEFDHHPGVVFDNEEPSHHHIHTILRTPNGGEYGTDLLARHHAEFDHSHADHHH